MSSSDRQRLYRHYNQKYSRQGGPPPEVLIRRNPRDRFEASIKWAGTGEKLLEIGAGSGNLIKALRPRFKEFIATEISSPRIAALNTTHLKKT